MNREQFFNLTLEDNLLEVLINDHKALDEAIVIKDDIFYSSKNKVLWSSIKALWKDNKEINPANIYSILKTDIDKVGGISRVTELQINYISSAGYKNIIKTLEEYRIRRELYNTKIEIEKQLEKNKSNEEIIQAINNKVENLLNADSEESGDITEVLEELALNLEERTVNKGKVRGIETKLIGLDYKINGLNKQEQIVIAGRPASGKTTLANNIALRVASQNKKVVIFNLEMSKTQIFEKLLSNVALVDMNKLKIGDLGENEWQKIGEGQNKLLKLRDNLRVFDSCLHIDKIIANAKKLKKQNKLDVLIIDYLQLVECQSKGNREQEISSISRRLKLLSKELNINVIVLSQLSRACEQRTDHRPILSDLRESGAIEQDADIILFAYRDEYYNAQSEDKNLMEIIVGKNRNGSTGTEKVAWIPQYQRVANLDVRS